MATQGCCSASVTSGCDMPKTATLRVRILNQKIEQRVHGIFVPQLGDFGESLALQGKQLRILHRSDHDGFGAGNFLPFVVPVVGWSQHVFADALARGRIFQALDQFCVAAIVGPRRNEGGEIVVPGGVGVGIGGDVGAGGAGRVDFGDDFRHASPVVLAGDFDVPDLDGNVGFAADAQRFIDRRPERSRFRCACASRKCRRTFAASVASAISSSVFA